MTSTNSPLTDSNSRPSRPLSLVSATPPESQNYIGGILVCPPSRATARAKMLMGSYRHGEAADPDTYVASIALVFGQYSEDVVIRVTDPRSGIQRSIGWLPNVKEVIEACEHEMRDVRRQECNDSMRRESALIGKQEEIPADEKERVKALFKKLQAETGFPDPNAYVPKHETVEDAQRAVADGFSHLQAPMTTGEALKRAMGRLYQQEAA